MKNYFILYSNNTFETVQDIDNLLRYIDTGVINFIYDIINSEMIIKTKDNDGKISVGRLKVPHINQDPKKKGS